MAPRTSHRRPRALVAALALSVAGGVLGAVAPSPAASAAESSPADWGTSRWIWSSASTDRGPASKWVCNDYLSFVMDDADGAPTCSAGTPTAGNPSVVETYPDLAAKQNVWMDFRRDFTLAAKPASAMVKVAADSKYWMWVNGEQAVFEGIVKRGPNSSDSYFDEVDFAKYLKAGANDIAIQVWHWGGEGGYSYNPSGSAGLLFSSSLADTANQGRFVESGDGKWLALKDPGNKVSPDKPAIRLPEKNVVVDARDAIDWTESGYDDYAEDGWNTASIIGLGTGADQGKPGSAPWNGLWERPIPQWRDYGRTIAEAKPVVGFPGDGFTAKNLADLGITDGAYSITTDLSIDYATLAGYYHAANASLLFGVNGNTSYKAKIDLATFYSSATPRPTLTVTKTVGSTTTTVLAAVDISSVYTSANREAPHTLKLDVISPTKADFRIDGQLVGTITDDLTDVDTSFGFLRDGFPIAGYDAGSNTIHEVSVGTTGGTVYTNSFTTDEDNADFPLGTLGDEGLVTKYAVRTLYGEPVKNGQRYRVRLPHNAQFVPYLKLGAGTTAGRQVTMMTDTFNLSALKTAYVTKAGAQEFEALNWISGDYLYVDVPTGVEVTDLGYRETGYDVPSGESSDFEGHFDSVVESDDPSLQEFTGGHTWTRDQATAENNFYDEIWKKAVRTVYVTIRDTYMDCPDRERAPYIGDAMNEIEQGYYSLGPGLNALDASTVRSIVDWQREKQIDGRTYYLMSNVRPGTNQQEIVSQSLGAAVAAQKHYEFTGDAELLQYSYQKLYNYLTNWDMQSTGTYAGLVANRPASTTMDKGTLVSWFDWGNNQDTLLETNLWWYISAMSIREMADVAGVPATAEQKAWLDERLASVRDNFEKFWNPTLNAYATPWSTTTWYQPKVAADNSHLVDDRANALAVVYGLVPEDRYQAMRDALMGTATTPAYQNASIYIEKYVLQALYMMGYPADAMTRMADRQMEITNRKDSTLPEEWQGGSKNHGWSGGAMVTLSRYAAGVQPTAPGYGTWEVVPQLGRFTSIDTRVPSEIGDIDVTLGRDDEALALSLTSPGNTAEVYVPVRDGEVAVQTAGQPAQYLREEQRYHQTYAVFRTTAAGEYSWQTAVRGEASHLQLLVTSVQALVDGGSLGVFTDASVAGVVDALATAKAVLAEAETKSQAQLDAAQAALADAVAQLTLKPVPVDTGVLRAMVDVAAGIDLSVFTPKSGAVLTRALTRARAVLARESTQAEVTAAVTQLSNAIAQLQPRVSPDLTTVGKPVVKGRAKVGKVLTVKLSTPKGATVRYQWLASGKAVKGATKATLKVAGKLRGKRISVRVTVSLAGYAKTVVSAKTAKVRR